MAQEWVIYSGPSLHSESVPPTRVGLDDGVVDMLDEADPEAWGVLLIALAHLGIMDE